MAHAPADILGQQRLGPAARGGIVGDALAGVLHIGGKAALHEARFDQQGAAFAAAAKIGNLYRLDA